MRYGFDAAKAAQHLFVGPVSVDALALHVTCAPPMVVTDLLEEIAFDRDGRLLLAADVAPERLRWLALSALAQSALACDAEQADCVGACLAVPQAELEASLEERGYAYALLAEDFGVHVSVMLLRLALFDAWSVEHVQWLRTLARADLYGWSELRILRMLVDWSRPVSLRSRTLRQAI